jgi:hypothetical protein
LFGTLLAHGPPDSIHDIALATSIVPHKGTYPRGKRDLKSIHKGLEARYENILYPHKKPPTPPLLLQHQHEVLDFYQIFKAL